MRTKMDRETILKIVIFIILTLIITPFIRISKKQNKKQVEKITKDFKLVSSFDSFKMYNGKLIEYESKGDTIGYHHIKAKFERDKILTNDEIDLSIRYAFMNKMYHGKEITYNGTKTILLEADFYLTNKYVQDEKYRTAVFIIWKKKDGNIKINNSLDIIDSLAVNSPTKFRTKKISISSTYYDNKENEQISTIKLVETLVSNQKMYWTIREIRTNKSTGFNDSIFLNMALIFSLKHDYTIDTLMNWSRIKEILIKSTNKMESKLITDYPKQRQKIRKQLKVLRNQFSSRSNIENSIGYEAFAFYRLFSKDPFNTHKKDEIINIYPLSKLPILIKTDVEFINSYQDQTSQYHMQKVIDFDKINEVDGTLQKPLLKETVSNMKYIHNSDYFLNSDCIPYLVKDKFTIEIDDMKMFKTTRIELLN